jgi:hypothetical protein
MDIAIPVGAIIEVSKGPAQHPILVSEYGTAIHSTPERGAIEEPLSDAIGGRKWRIVEIIPPQLLEAVLRRARSMLGLRWTLLSSNCQHFLNLALGRGRRSEQLDLMLLMGGLALGLFVILKLK